MKIERLRKSHKKEIIIGVIFTAVIGGALTFKLTHSKYRVTQSIDLAEGVIQYIAPDFKIMAMYKNDGNGDENISEVPTDNYILNTSKSICKVDDVDDSNITIEYLNGKINFIGVTKSKTKCYLYFDIKPDTEKPIISNVATSVTKTEINVTVSASDNKGVTEYWYSIDNGTFIKVTGNVYKFSGLTAGSIHTIKVYVKDAAGNQSDTTNKTVTTNKPTASETILANITVKSGTPTFSQIADTDEGVYQTSDGMYGGITYYFRGAVTNNYVKFSGYCWRIIRINGDKTIRLIYDGTTCHENGTNTAESIAVTGQAYNPSYNQSYYVGWTQNGTQRTDSTTATASNAKTQTETWYNNNIGNNSTYASKVADGKFCNDRNVDIPPSSFGWGTTYTTTWSANGTLFAYSGAKRLYEDYNPTFICPSGDVYTLKVGAITADEVEFAGGKNEDNTSYYLYNGQFYWTMSPYNWISPNSRVFIVNQSGFLSSTFPYNICGLRPVINLKADTTFTSGGTGIISNPYVVQ